MKYLGVLLSLPLLMAALEWKKIPKHATSERGDLWLSLDRHALPTIKIPRLF